MGIFSRRAEPPGAGWFQIGDVPEQAAPRRRGSGRVSLSVVQDEPAAGTAPSQRVAALERAYAIAEGALGHVAELRYGAVGLCALALVLLTVVFATIVSHDGGSGPAAVSVAALRREQARVAGLEGELRFSQQQLAAARAALSQAQQASARATAPGAVNHQSRKGRKR